MKRSSAALNSEYTDCASESGMEDAYLDEAPSHAPIREFSSS